MPVHSHRGRRAVPPPYPARAPSLGRRGTRGFAATAAGAVAAALLHAPPAAGQQGGGDPRDQPYATAIVNQALETERTNVEIPWSNPETGHSGTIVILRTYYRDGGSTPCRDYERTLERPGSPPVVTEGTGCRVGPARWQLDERTARAAPAREPRPLLSPVPAGAEPAAPEPPARDTRSVGDEATEAGTPARPEPAEASVTEAPAAARSSAAEPEPRPAFPTYTMPSKAAL